MVVYPILIKDVRDLVVLLVGVVITLIFIFGLDLITKFKDWLKNSGNDSGRDVNFIYNRGGEISEIEVVNDDGSVVKIIIKDDDAIEVVSRQDSEDKVIFNIDGEINEFKVVHGDSRLVTYKGNRGNSEFGKDIISGEVEVESVDSESVNMDELLDSDGSSLGLSGEELDEDIKKSSALIQYRDALRQLKAESGKGSGITLEEAAKEDVRLLNMTLEELLTYEPDDDSE